MIEKVLVIDDDKLVRESIHSVLKDAGYSVFLSSCAGDGIKKAQRTSPDMILLDMVLPEMSGIDVCRMLKQNAGTRHIPVIMMTGKKKDETDVVTGLETGADDYIFKPFGCKELLGRVKALLRRAYYKGEMEEVLEEKGLSINVGKREVKVNGKNIVLTPKEFELLYILVKKKDYALKSAYLLETVWGYENERITTETLASHMYRLRRKLGSKAGKKILSIPRVGYKFESEA